MLKNIYPITCIALVACITFLKAEPSLGEKEFIHQVINKATTDLVTGDTGFVQSKSAEHIQQNSINSEPMHDNDFMF